MTWKLGCGLIMGKGASHFSFDSRLSYWFYCLWHSSFHQTLVHIFLLLFSSSVVSNCLWPRGLHHTRLHCPSLSPGVCANSCPLSLWCHPTISSSVAHFSFCPQSFPASVSFPMSWLFASGGQSIGASASLSVFLMNIQSWCPLQLLLLSHFSHVWLLATPWTAGYQAPPSMGFSRQQYWSWLPLPDLFDLLAVRGTLESSSAPQFKHINPLALSLCYGLTLTFIHGYWKNHNFDSMDLCHQSDKGFCLWFLIHCLGLS